MKPCQWFPKIERYLDDELQDTTTTEAHLQQCPLCTQHLNHLKKMRNAITENRNTPQIQEAQFPAFMQGIQQRKNTQTNPFKGWWALASLTAAAILVAVATISIFRPQDKPVNATEVESVSTELEGATVDWYESDDVMRPWDDPPKDNPTSSAATPMK